MPKPEYRIAVPVTETLYDRGPGAGIPTTRTHVLWEGTNLPGEDEVAAAQMGVPQGELRELHPMSHTPGDKDFIQITPNSKLKVQKRRVVPFLWKTVLTVDAAQASEEDVS